MRRKRQGKPTLIDPALFSSAVFRLGISQQMLQQIALGGTMIALPIYLQMVLEYNAMEAGLSLAPLSLSMFGMAILAEKKAGGRRPSSIVRWGFVLLTTGLVVLIPIVPRADSGWYLVGPAADRGVGAGSAGVPAQQLHAGADLSGTRQRGGRRQLGGGLVRTVVRAGVRRCHHAGDAVLRLHQQGGVEHRPSDRPSRSRSPRRWKRTRR